MRFPINKNQYIDSVCVLRNKPKHIVYHKIHLWDWASKEYTTYWCHSSERLEIYYYPNAIFPKIS